MYNKHYYFVIILTVCTFIIFESCSYDKAVSVQNKSENWCDEPNIFCGTPGSIRLNPSGQNSCDGIVSSIDLWADIGNLKASILIGHVQFILDGAQWKVKYIFTEPFFVPDVIHFSIADTLIGIPHTNGGVPIPTQFEYSFNGPFSSDYTFPISLPESNLIDDIYYIAAYVSGGFGFSELNQYTPTGCVTLSNISYNFNTGTGEGTSYLKLKLSDAGIFNGTFDGWDADLASAMANGVYNCAVIYSFNEPLPPELTGFPKIDHPENLDIINYIINFYWNGKIIQPVNSNCDPVGVPDTVMTIEIQKAIWSLIDEGPGNIWNELPWDQNIVNAIVCDAIQHDGYIPSCENNEGFALLVVPIVPQPEGSFSATPIIIKLPCSIDGASAWGDGKYGANFSASNWSTYFIWSPDCQ